MPERGKIYLEKKFTDEVWFGEHLPALMCMRVIEAMLGERYPDVVKAALAGNIEQDARHLRLVKMPSKSDTIVSSGMHIELFMKALADEAALPFKREWYAARAYLLSEYEALVVSVANKYQWHGKLPESVTFDDLKAVGRIGLLRGILKYDPAQETRLSTIATYWIRSELSKFIKFESRRSHNSLDEELGEGEEGYSRYDQMPDSVSTPHQAELNMAIELVRQALSEIYLSDRDRDIVMMRLVGEMTLEEVGEVYGVSREWVRQIEAKAVRMLRNNASFRRAAAMLNIIRDEAELKGKVFKKTAGLRNAKRRK